LLVADFDDECMRSSTPRDLFVHRSVYQRLARLPLQLRLE
jgi:hypothetical protein